MNDLSREYRSGLEYNADATRTALNGVGSILSRFEGARTLSTSRHIDDQQYEGLLPILDRAREERANIHEVATEIIPSLQITIRSSDHQSWERNAHVFTELAERMDLGPRFLENIDNPYLGHPNDHRSRPGYSRELIVSNLTNMASLQVLKALGYLIDWNRPTPIVGPINKPISEDEVRFTERLLHCVRRVQGSYSPVWQKYYGDWGEIEGTAMDAHKSKSLHDRLRDDVLKKVASIPEEDREQYITDKVLPLLQIALPIDLGLDYSPEVFNVVYTYQDRFGENSKQFIGNFIGRLEGMAEYNPEYVADILSAMPEEAREEYSESLEPQITKGREKSRTIGE